MCSATTAVELSPPDSGVGCVTFFVWRLVVEVVGACASVRGYNEVAFP